ncbi:CPBP family intramembrane metalloprotease [Roseovarius aestuarii]|nr:CPBP family intramembrane metalloprotease [Roseovarius aestuarii]
MRYPRHHALVAPARSSASLWRLAGGVTLLVAVFFAMSTAYGWIITAALPDTAWGADGRGIQDASTPLGALVNLYIFALLIISLGLSMTLIHDRRWTQMIGPPDAALIQGRRVVLVLAALYTVLSLLPLPDALAPHLNLDVKTWLSFLPIAVLGLILQVSAEELIFRGYLQSQLAARFEHPLIWMGVPSVLFGALHYSPAVMGDTAWLVVVWATLFGLAAADLTARSGTLGPAVALHLVNNVSAILIMAPSGNFDGLALTTYPFSADDTDLLLAWMPVEMMVLLCSWLAARLALRV